MADTQRSLTTLTTLFADNVSGDISPQDLRDFLISMKPPWGSFSINVAADTTIAEAGTYYKMGGTTTAGSLYNVTMPVDGRLTYTGAPDRHFHIAVTVSATCAGSNQVLGMKVAKNGAVIDASTVRFKIGTGSDVHSTALHCDVMLSTNDYLELYVTNETSTSAVTVNKVYFFGLGMFM